MTPLRENSRSWACQTTHHGKWLKLCASADITTGLFPLFIRYFLTITIKYTVKQTYNEWAKSDIRTLNNLKKHLMFGFLT